MRESHSCAELDFWVFQRRVYTFIGVLKYLHCSENAGLMNTTKQIALERINTLFHLSGEVIYENPERAQRYVHIARRISMATKIRLPAEYRRHVCRHCKRFILPGINCRVRIQQRREPHLVVTCLLCGGHMRFPLRDRRKAKHGNSKNEAKGKT